MKRVRNFGELMAALQSGETEIVVTCGITALHSVILPRGVTLRGEAQTNGELPIVLFINTDGFGVVGNNAISDLVISAPGKQKAIYAALVSEDAGSLRFSNLTVTGQLSVIMRKGTDKVDVRLENVDIVSADTRHYLEQPQKYGVNVLQGALTLYTFSDNKDSLMTVTAIGVTVGRKHAPVSGSGIFIAGFGDAGGRTAITKLQTGAIYSTGRLAEGIADYIAGGVFIVNGAHAQEVVHDGEVVTYGVNDMVLDAWGEVDTWTVNAPVTSYGPSGIGFVNFGVVKTFDASRSDFTTYGQGARGYNQYDGTVDTINFKSVTTYGNGSVAIQISKPIGTLTVSENVATHGGIGTSLVKGVNVELPAYALSVKAGGEIARLSVGGTLSTGGDGVTAYIIETGGVVRDAKIGGVVARGQGAKASEIAEGAISPAVS